MKELLENILKAIKDNTHTYEDSYCEEKFKYVDELEITRAVLTIFRDYLPKPKITDEQIEELYKYVDENFTLEIEGKIICKH